MKKVFMDEFRAVEESWNECDRLTDGGKVSTGEGDPKPGEGDVKPGEGDPKPGEGDPKPGEGDPKPGEGDPAEKMVPLSAVTAERTKRQAVENNFTILQNQIIAAQQANQTQQPGPKNEIDSLDDESIVNGRDVKKMFTQLKTLFSEQLQTVNSTNRAGNAELLVKTDHPDYDEVIKTNLVNVLDVNPGFREALASAGKEFQPLLAYAIGTLDPEYVKKANEGTTRDIQAKIKANAAKPGSVNAAGGTASPDDLVSVIASESQEDFKKRVARVLAKG